MINKSITLKVNDMADEKATVTEDLRKLVDENITHEKLRGIFKTIADLIDTIAENSTI